MSSNIGLLINTCKHFFTNIPDIIKNIEECNFPKENVLIVSGQEDNNSIHYQDNIKIVKVDYTGTHLTGVIYISENIDSFKNIKYWIILPDTIKLSKLFYVNILKYYTTYLENKEVDSLPFINPKIRPTMDMGILHINHIYNMSEYLQKIKKVPPYDINDIIELKRQLIYDENTILGLPAMCINKSTKFNYVNNPIQPPTIFITDNNSEIIEKRVTFNDRFLNEVYLFNLGMYKYQRNFLGPTANFIMEL
jgi:hypothetical protein